MVYVIVVVPVFFQFIVWRLTSSKQAIAWHWYVLWVGEHQVTRTTEKGNVRQGGCVVMIKWKKRHLILCYKFGKYFVNVYYYVFPKNNCSWKELIIFQTSIFLYLLGMDYWEIDYRPLTPPPKKVLPEAVVPENLDG